MDSWVARRVDVDQATGCWIWRGNKLARKGYGITTVHCTPWLAHRFVWHHIYGRELPPQLHHKCEQRACVNPDHLEPCTPKEHKAHHRATHCKWGHEFTPENTWLNPQNGYRQCRACFRRRANETYARKRARMGAT